MSDTDRKDRMRQAVETVLSKIKIPTPEQTEKLAQLGEPICGTEFLPPAPEGDE